MSDLKLVSIGLTLKLLAWYCPLLPFFFPFLLSSPSIFFHLSSFIFHLSSFIFHLSSDRLSPLHHPHLPSFAHLVPTSCPPRAHLVDSVHIRQLKGSPTSSLKESYPTTFQSCNENTTVFNRAFNSLCQHYSLATQHIVEFHDLHSAVYVFAPCQRLQTPSAAQAAIVPYTAETL